MKKMLVILLRVWVIIFILFFVGFFIYDMGQDHFKGYYYIMNISPANLDLYRNLSINFTGISNSSIKILFP